MPYCNTVDVQRILPEKVSIGDSNIGVPSPGRAGNQGSQRSNISTQEAERYIEYASSYLDARLRPIYSCPLRRTKSYETEALANIISGTNITVTVNDSGSFYRGSYVRIQDLSNMETSTVLGTPTLTTITLDRVVGSYSTANNTIISVLEYPDPVPLITAQMAASLILDRIFVSQNSPDVSEFGKTQRNLARAQIENILSGEVLLFGQEHVGRRFVRMSLLDKWSSPVGEIQKGSDKE